MRIDIQTIPHDEQRYETSGDWFWTGSGPDAVLNIRGSYLGNADMEFCEVLHEMIEAYLCKRMDISQKQVDDFDMAYEAAHQRGDAAYPCGCPHQRLSDPGSDPHSPYMKPHLLAEAAEAVVARALRVCWKAYDELVEKPPE